MIYNTKKKQWAGLGGLAHRHVVRAGSHSGRVAFGLSGRSAVFADREKTGVSK